MKTTLTILSAGAAVLFSSCASNPAAQDPEYKAYLADKKAKEAEANNPYGAPVAENTNNATNPYGVPSHNGATNSANAPLQPLPGLSGDYGTAANPATVQGGATMNIPAGSSNQNIPMLSHTVVKGDTVWGLTKKYNVSQYDILTANSMSDTTIRIGQVLQIPSK